MITPLRDKICVTLMADEEKTPGGIFRPGNIDKAHVKGKILSVGSGYFSSNGVIVPLEVSVDDVVVFNKNDAVMVKEGDDSFYLLSEAAVTCLLKE